MKILNINYSLLYSRRTRPLSMSEPSMNGIRAYGIICGSDCLNENKLVLSKIVLDDGREIICLKFLPTSGNFTLCYKAVGLCIIQF